MHFHRIASMLAAIALIAIASSALAQDQTRFVLNLNDELVKNLRSFGSLSSNVDDQFKERISMVEVQFDGNTSVPATTIEAPISIVEGVAGIAIDDSMIEKIRQQPVRINVPAEKRSFDKIMLNYQVSTSAPENPTAIAMPMLNEAGEPVDMFFIRLSNGESMSGGVDGFDKFSMETRFGTVSMPMDQVAGIKFHVDGKDSAVVILNNGDSITGVPTIPEISLKTDWGKADIEPAFIDSIATTTSAKFTQVNSDFGLRWELKTGASFAPGDPATTGR